MKTKKIIELLSELSGIFQDPNSIESLMITDPDLISDYNSALCSTIIMLEKMQSRNEAIQKAKRR